MALVVKAVGAEVLRISFNSTRPLVYSFAVAPRRISYSRIEIVLPDFVKLYNKLQRVKRVLSPHDESFECFHRCSLCTCPMYVDPSQVYQESKVRCLPFRDLCSFTKSIHNPNQRSHAINNIASHNNHVIDKRR